MQLPPFPALPSIRQVTHSIKRGGRVALPGLLPIEPAKEMVSTLRKRYRARVFASLLIGLVLAGLWVSAAPVSRRIKAWQSRRLAAQAEELVDKGELTRAVAKARAAFELRETEPAAWHAVARVLTKADHASQALLWWGRVAQSSPLSIADRRSYAAAALSAGELLLASEQIDFLLRQSPNPPPQDLLLAAKLSTLRGDSGGCVKYAGTVLAIPNTTSAESLEAVEDLLLSVLPQSSSYSAAVQRLGALARSDDQAISLHALRIIAAEPRRPRLSDSRPLLQPLLLHRDDPNLPSAKEVAERMESNPAALPYDYLLALDLRTQNEPGQAEKETQKAIESFSHGDEQTLISLGGWLYDHGRFDSILQVIPLQKASQSRALFLERADALYALGRFSELADLVGDENSILDPTLQHLLLAIARSKLGEPSASNNEWERAVQAADTEQQYLAVAEFAQRNGVPKTADNAYAALLFKQPHLRFAYMARLTLAEKAGETARARDLATKIAELWPEDSNSHMLGLYLGLLLEASPEEVRSAADQASSFLQHHPRDIGASMVLALAHLKMGEQAAALRAVSEQNAPASAPMAVRAAALAANGWRDQARQEAEKLTRVQLLPEERALVAPLLERE